MSNYHSDIDLEDIRDVRNSGLFDEKWYLENFPDVRILGMDPIKHFLWVGAMLGRNPSPNFDMESYLREYGDVEKANLNPLLHYIRWGSEEKRSVFPMGSAGLSSRLNLQDEFLTLNSRLKSEGHARVVVYESHNLKMQGAPNSLFEIASGIKRNGRYQPIMTCNTDGPLSELYAKKGIPFFIHNISQNRMKDDRNREEFLLNLSDYYKSLKADIVHVNTLQNFHSVLAAKKAGCHVLWNIRESEDPATYYDYLPLDARDLAYRAVNVADAVVFVADATRRRWEEFWSRTGKSYTIHNGISMERLMRPLYGINRAAIRARYRIAEKDIVVLNIGTISERKGQADLVEALRLLDQDLISRIVVAMVGFNNSHYSKIVRSGLEELKAKGLRTILVDESQDEDERGIVSELYLSGDAFVLCSRLESYPRVILEALGFGLPIISTPCFGVREQLVDGISGLLYPEGKADVLATHITRLVEDVPFRNALAIAGEHRLTQLNSYSGMIGDYQRIYDGFVN